MVAGRTGVAQGYLRVLQAEPTELFATNNGAIIHPPLPLPHAVPLQNGGSGARASVELWLADYQRHPFGQQGPASPVRTYWTAPDCAGDVAPVLIEVARGIPLDLTVHNALSGPRPMVDVYEVADMAMDNSGCRRCVVHLHGALVPATSDGFPVPVPQYRTVFGPGEQQTYHYQNDQPATLLWFHDHTMDVTSRNVYSGQTGLYVIRDPAEQTIGLPTDAASDQPHELALAISDRNFTRDGQLLYGGMFDGVDQVPEYKGSVLCVNGAAQPLHALPDAGLYRLHLLNGCTGRFLRLRLRPLDGNGDVDLDDANALSMTVIGADAGFLTQSVEVTALSLAPAERSDLLVDLSAHAGATLVLTNEVFQESDVGSPVLTGNGGDTSFTVGGPGSPPNSPPVPGPTELFEAMRFEVPEQAGQGPSIADIMQAWPADGPLQGDPGLDAAVADQALPVNRRFKLTENGAARIVNLGVGPSAYAAWSGRTVLTAPGGTLREDFILQPPVAEEVYADTFEIWEIENDSPDTHPMHVHQCSMQVVSRQPLTPGGPASPEVELGADGLLPEEAGAPKDTIKVPTGYRTRVAIKFGPHLGRAVWHCHITEHEDMGMMRQLLVVPAV